MTVPLIGITTYVADARWSSWERTSAVLPESYYELTAEAGGRPMLLPPLRGAPEGPATGAAEVVGVLDGLLLTGGGDVDPAAYAEETHPDVAGVNGVRDESERALLAAALAVDLPVLAICRGCQVLNVERGGTLHQHLPDVIGRDTHRTAPLVFGDVDMATEPGTRTAAIFGAAPTALCSHHQAIERLGTGLVATAHAADGVIEAVELAGARFVLGVQWHPEEARDIRPFRALVAAAREYHEARSSRTASAGLSAP
ncbi:MAG TPA: gamma-glutamyl-gamma-aminobutyrate hydrolase family protein [Acidimicrobiales bacterium]|nr:gamma-glutamyl-gamma-aminobutyrate hydrolase family protein [Acidimicrobiales bacterium]